MLFILCWYDFYMLLIYFYDFNDFCMILICFLYDCNDFYMICIGFSYDFYMMFI